MQHTAAPAVADCESKAAAPVIDTILAVGFAAATLAAVSSDDEVEDGSSAWSPVSTLGVGTATTAAFVASAVHGHNSIQSCLAQRQIRAAEDIRKVAAAKKRAVDHATLAPPATYVASALAAPR